MSEYPTFELVIDNNDGTFTPVPSTAVEVYDVTHDVALADTASDSDGTVPGASVAVDAGTLLRFSFRLANGICGYAENTTA